MSIRHYYIGVGGTGARVAEALVHLCAAGLGPDELFLMLIDPDAGNGNLSRTTELVTKYQNIQKQMGTRAEGVNVFRTKIVTPKPEVWTIFEQQNQTLGAFIGLGSLEATAPPLKHFAELLFTEEDLHEKLNEGFRGRPAIGAVVMAQPNPEEPPWSDFWAEIAKINRADEAKVFVVGSIFGGTGAAGIPTLGASAVIRDRAALDAEKQKSKIYLGSCLVLPYFTFDANVPLDERTRLFVKPEDFPLATSSALYYYLTKQLSYDEMYLIGDSGSEIVGQFAAGAATQKNRAHYVELAAGLSALDFYVHGERTPTRERQFFISARDGAGIDWQGLPSARHTHLVSEVQTAVRYRLTAAGMFFYSLAAYGHETLETLKDPGAVPPTWFKDHFVIRKGTDDARRDPRNPLQAETIRHVEQYGERFLLWLRDIMADQHVSLLKIGAVLDEGGNVLPWRNAPVGQFVAGAQQKVGFDRFVNDCLNEESFVEANAGEVAADRYLNLFSLAANRFTNKHLNVLRPQTKG
jgi:hypothetical protein